MLQGFPKYQSAVTVAGDGLIDVNSDDCRKGFSVTGLDKGFSTIISDNVDYKNAYVGGYDFGDIQFRNHASFDCTELVYWKTTKVFADGCSTHFQSSFYENGNMVLLILLFI